ncbi:hypothetical protein F5Y06DRAFT_164160 [Hypoxylon sp. FL0890]|nr:hypothetical protein F5Y06DRAFT_164160 [Hypoxylon sp. FL0890]
MHLANRHRWHHLSYSPLSTGQNPPAKKQTAPETTWFSSPPSECLSYHFFPFTIICACSFSAVTTKYPELRRKVDRRLGVFVEDTKETVRAKVLLQKLDACILGVIPSDSQDGYSHESRWLVPSDEEEPPLDAYTRTHVWPRAWLTLGFPF